MGTACSDDVKEIKKLESGRERIRFDTVSGREATLTIAELLNIAGNLTSNARSI
jgi:hypothetical protein